MARLPSGFKSADARERYCRLYDEAISLSEAPIVESDIETSFGTTHVLTAGDRSKPPLIALHGLSMSSTMWIPLLPCLTLSHHVVMLDRVGDLNKSRATVAVPSPRRVVEWMCDTLGTLGIDRAALVGESIGAWMATHFAMSHPHRVDRLALLGPAGIVSNQHAKWIATMGFRLRVRPTVDRVERALVTTVMPATRARLRENPWRPISQQFIVGTPSFRFNLREPRPMRCDIARLATSDIRILVLVPRDESLHDGSTMADRFRARLPRARVVLVDDANHLVPIDRPELVADELERFLGAT